jgi:hypothetical protein
MRQRVLGALFGILMIVFGVHTFMQGMREMRGPDDGGLLDRPLPGTATLRAWEECTPAETAYAASRPTWTAVSGVDPSAPWTVRERTAALALVFPATRTSEAPAPRDCTEAGGAIFRRVASVDAADALAHAEDVAAHARVIALAGYIDTRASLLAYCGDDVVDDYQWECMRLNDAMMRMATTALTLAARAESDEPELREQHSWSHGLTTIRGSIGEMAASAVRVLALPEGVRPDVRSLVAHTLAEDLPAARAVAGDATPFVALRAQLAALAEHEAQPDVRESITLALTRWPQ